MESVNTVLSVIASLLSIIATLVSLKNKEELNKLRVIFENNGSSALGNENVQVTGVNNRVSTHVK